MPCNALIEAAIGKDAEGGRQMLLAIQALILKVVKLGIAADFELLAVLGRGRDLDL